MTQTSEWERLNCTPPESNHDSYSSFFIIIWDRHSVKYASSHFLGLFHGTNHWGIILVKRYKDIHWQSVAVCWLPCCWNQHTILTKWLLKPRYFMCNSMKNPTANEQQCCCTFSISLYLSFAVLPVFSFHTWGIYFVLFETKKGILGSIIA